MMPAIANFTNVTLHLRLEGQDHSDPLKPSHDPVMFPLFIVLALVSSLVVIAFVLFYVYRYWNRRAKYLPIPNMEQSRLTGQESSSLCQFLTHNHLIGFRSDAEKVLQVLAFIFTQAEEKEGIIYLEGYATQNVGEGSRKTSVNIGQTHGRFCIANRAFFLTQTHERKYDMQYSGYAGMNCQQGFQGEWSISHTDCANKGTFHLWPSDLIRQTYNLKEDLTYRINGQTGVSSQIALDVIARDIRTLFPTRSYKSEVMKQLEEKATSTSTNRKSTPRYFLGRLKDYGSPFVIAYVAAPSGLVHDEQPGLRLSHM